MHILGRAWGPTDSDGAGRGEDPSLTVRLMAQGDIVGLEDRGDIIGSSDRSAARGSEDQGRTRRKEEPGGAERMEEVHRDSGDNGSNGACKISDGTRSSRKLPGKG